jgi:hypothetical protein
MDTFDLTLRTAVYRHFASAGQSPTLDAMREAIGATNERVTSSPAANRHSSRLSCISPETNRRLRDALECTSAPAGCERDQADLRADRPDGPILGSPEPTDSES